MLARDLYGTIKDDLPLRPPSMINSRIKMTYPIPSKNRQSTNIAPTPFAFPPPGLVVIEMESKIHTIFSEAEEHTKLFDSSEYWQQGGMYPQQPFTTSIDL